MLIRIRRWVFWRWGLKRPKFRKWWYDGTGTWLWGFHTFITELGQDDVTTDNGTSIDQEEWEALLDDLFGAPSTKEDKMLITTPHGWKTLASMNLKTGRAKPPDDIY